jgi:two-component system nitrogen regulation sensor histidine kinase NtrY
MKIRLSPRLTIILVAVAGLLLVGGFLVAVQKGQDESAGPAGSFLLTALSFANLLLMTVLLFVLFRELAKGYLEWRRQREGARFRTRLLTAFVLLGLLPSLLLFVGATMLIESTVDRWFSSPVNIVAGASQRLVDQALDQVRDQTYRKAQAMAWQLSQVSPAMRVPLASHLWKAGDMDTLCLVAPGGTVLYRRPETLPDPGAYKTGKVFQAAGLKGWIDLTPEPMVVSGVRIDGQSGVMVGARLSKTMFEEAKFISGTNKQYLQIRSQRRALKISMISSFLALTLLVTFVAVWVGSRLSREVSVPLQLLMEGTRELSRGNLSHRISYDAKDEVGMVTQSFNQMAHDLETSKGELELSNQELRLATESAERRNRYIETLLATLNIGVVSTDPGGEVRTLNPKAREILGLKESEPRSALLGLPAWAEVAQLLQGLAGRSMVHREVTLSLGAEPRILSITGAPLREPSGEVFGTLVILEDITDLSRAQRIAAWQEVAQRMAHEVKNPLTPIRLSAQRIRKKAQTGAADLSQAALEGTRAIEREVEAMMTMVNEFSRFARLPEVSLEPGSLPSLIRSTVSGYEAASGAVSFQLDLPERFPPVRLDKEQMGRVFKNLLENSLHAMEMAGTITIRLREEEGRARVRIRDTGPGIPSEARSRLFFPYYSTKRKGGGLGLAIAARILEEHGGSIRVDEEYSAGAGFILDLPLQGA